jgi:transketolase
MPNHRELANAIRFLSIDAIEKANSGHPGMPLGMADIAEVLWYEFLCHNPNNPNWSNRDRFVLSNGHGSMLLYALLHLTGYELSLDDIKNFRQLHSITPGHPEVDMTPGVETTTGPLGQGLANAVGMAMAEKILAAHFNRAEFNIVDHHTYVLLGDGCLMEGISHEVCALAGTLGLGKLVCFWDDNHITIDGDTAGWFTDNTPERFAAYGWHVISVVDGHDAVAIKAAIEEAHTVKDRPSLICCQTTIGYGSPNKAGKASCHGSPLGKDEIALVRKELGWEHSSFEIPAAIYQTWNAKKQGSKLEAEWLKKFYEYQQAYPDLALEFERRIEGELPAQWQEVTQKLLAEFVGAEDKIATRKASQQVLEKFGAVLPELLGGSADLSGSNLTMWSGSKPLSKEQADANYIYYGVREFGMSAIMNGLALHGGFIPYGGTFLVFYSYAVSAVRMAAMMRQKEVFVYTHDSIGLGEDGPTHQPIEQAAQLRLIPNLSVWRPCDTLETFVAWQMAIERKDGPSALLLSRQGLPVIKRDENAINNIKRGGYVIFSCQEVPDGIIIATGSEVALAVAAAKRLKEKGRAVNVVSMPSVDVFIQQDQVYRDFVLPATVTKRIVVEAGVTNFWHEFAGSDGHIIGIDHYGESAPADKLFAEFGLTVDKIVAAFV